MRPMSLPRPDPFVELIAARAAVEGRTSAPFPGLHFCRFSQPKEFRKTVSFGPTLTVVAQGRKQAQFGSVALEYEPRRYLLVTGEAIFQGRVVEASLERPYLCVSLDLPCDLIAKTLLALADAHAGPAGETAPALVADLEPAIKDAVVRLIEAADDPVERRLVAPLVLEELVFRLLRTDAAAVLRRAVARDRDAESIQEAMRFMRAQARRPLSVEAVARHVRMSPSHFAHRFRAVARVSPMRYLKQVRLNDARTLLVSDGLRVSEAAERVGYESASHFTRDFKSCFGVAPADYARRFRHTDVTGESQK